MFRIDMISIYLDYNIEVIVRTQHHIKKLLKKYFKVLIIKFIVLIVINKYIIFYIFSHDTTQYQNFVFISYGHNDDTDTIN